VGVVGVSRSIQRTRIPNALSLIRSSRHTVSLRLVEGFGAFTGHGSTVRVYLARCAGDWPRPRMSPNAFVRIQPSVDDGRARGRGCCFRNLLGRSPSMKAGGGGNQDIDSRVYSIDTTSEHGEPRRFEMSSLPGRSWPISRKIILRIPPGCRRSFPPQGSEN